MTLKLGIGGVALALLLVTAVPLVWLGHVAERTANAALDRWLMANAIERRRRLVRS